MDGIITVTNVEQQAIIETSGGEEEESSIPYVGISIILILVLMVFMRVKVSQIDEIKN